MTEKNHLTEVNRLQSELSSLLAVTREAVIVTQVDGTITGWNVSAERLYGYTAKEVIGHPFSILLSSDTATAFSLISERIRGGDTIEDLEPEQLRKDGRRVNALLTLSPIQDGMRSVIGVLCLATDVSEGTQFDRAKRDQLFLAALISSAEDAIFSEDPNGIITSWNPGAERMFGYTSDEIVGKAISKLIPPSSPDLESQVLERLRRGDRIEHYETQRVRKDGSIVDASLTVSSMKDSLGHFIGAFTIARDIGDRKRFEKAERDQLFLASIVSSAEDAIISKDLQGIVTSWNQSAERIFGYTPDEMVGQPITKLMPPNHSNEEQQILESIRRGKRVDHYEAQRVRKDGRTINVSLTISPIRDPLGRIVGASKIARDISERKRWQSAEAAQSFLGTLVESAEDAIISKDLDGIVTSWNPGAERLYGYAAKEIVGKPISMLIPLDQPDEEPRILERIRRGERIEHYETKRVRKDGTHMDVSLTVSPIKDTLGRIIGASKIARDISESKRLESREREVLRQAEKARKEAEKAREQAELASKAKEEFLATISHELRTPLNSILGWTHMLLNGELNAEDQQKGISTIDRNARSQAQLIEDLLDISRIISGKMRVDFKAVDMTAVISAAVEAVRPTAEAKRLSIDSTFSSGAGPIIGDAQRLQQVVWNLLSNAVKFTPRGGSIQVELRRVESQIELRVIDNGIGIDPAFLPYVFDRFSQQDSSITRSRGGLGMGLAIVKSLVELHGGVVSVSSPPEGRGTAFTVKLPVSAVREDATRQRPDSKATWQKKIEHQDNLIGLKILVVDDEPDSCDMLEIVFNKCGAIVETAQSADAALAIFDKWHPDILISDIGMPETDGNELIRIIREQRRSRIPAVALTAMARIEDRVKALAAGYQMYVAKPVELEELITIVSGLVGLVNRQTES